MLHIHIWSVTDMTAISSNHATTVHVHVIAKLDNFEIMCSVSPTILLTALPSEISHTG